MEIDGSARSLFAKLSDERAKGRAIGFVPTMGALHEGHLSLLRRAKSENDIVVLSIFVNPLQFGPNEDFNQYPRLFEADANAAEQVGVDYLFSPSVEEMYPEGQPKTSVHVATITEPMEGALRPGHFDGVATVVTKLFSIVGQCRAYFGEKDWQQLAMVKRMTSDLSLPVEVVPCPIVREPDGLAMSSRNIYLFPEEREAALALSRALRSGSDAIERGASRPDEVSGLMMEILSENPLVHPQYAEVVDSNLLVPSRIEGEVRLLVAAKVGKPKLIDNMGVFAK